MNYSHTNKLKGCIDTLISSFHTSIEMNTDIINSLDYLSQQLNRYLAIIIFIFGVIGNTLNCCILSQRVLRTNPCALLFLTSSFVDLISIIFGLTTRILAGWNLDPTATNNFACKLRVFIVFSTRTMAIWLIAFATVDRWLLSSTNFHRRQKSKLENIERGIFLTITLSILFYIHMLDCYEANLIDTPLKCYGKNRQCRLLTDLTYTLITIVLPSMVMIIFGLLIVSNIRHLRRRIQTVTIVSIIIVTRERDFKLRRTDRQLLRMLFIQIILLISFCIPQAIQKFYITFRSFERMSRQETILNHFLYNIEVLIAFIASGMPFYLYTLTGGTIFRRASFEFIQETRQKFTNFIGKFFQ